MPPPLDMKAILATIQRSIAAAETTTKVVFGGAVIALVIGIALVGAWVVGPSSSSPTDRAGIESADFERTFPEQFEHRARHDSELVARTNQALERVFGRGLAYVVVNSEWTYAEVDSVRETLDPKNKVVTSETSSTSNVGRDATRDFDSKAGNDVVLDHATGGETSSTTKSTIVGRETKHTKSTAPKLARLSVALFVDESLESRLVDVQSSVKASVGFDDERGDSFGSLAARFAGVKRDAAGKPIVPEVADRRGLIASLLEQRWLGAVAILALLAVAWRTVRGASRAAAKSPSTDVTNAAVMDEKQPAQIAKNEIDELVKTNPERVSSILSRWAVDEDAPAAGVAR